jgi:hypothetical protein
MYAITRRVLLLALLYLLVAALAQAESTGSANEGLSSRALLDELHDESGWIQVQGHGAGGVVIYRKEVKRSDLLGFRGELVVEAGSEQLFALISDLDRHAGLSDDIPLVLSQVLAQNEDGVDYLQLLDAPDWTLTRDRYWFNRSFVIRDLDGQVGHHRQSWLGIDPKLYPERWRALLSDHPGAVRTPINLGSWEVIPLSAGRSRLIYRVLSDPGGRLPSAVQRLVTARTLPLNLLQFQDEVRRQAGP